jgi:fructose-1,6-bisphosphatase/inositol monophosphatase family enzyme
MEGDKIVLMNLESFEQVLVPKTILGDRLPMLTDNMIVTLESYEEDTLNIQLPTNVTFEIVETDPVIKGATATASYKPAILTNGMRVLVPPYLTTGEKIVIKTEDASFVERAKINMHSSLISFITGAINKSSRFLYRDFFEIEMQQSSKNSNNDFVQRAYKKCEETLTLELAKNSEKYNFDIIPIESLNNFARSIPYFSIIVVAYNKSDNIPVAAVADFPILSETYYAEKGNGMWLQRHNMQGAGHSASRLRVSGKKDSIILLTDKAHNTKSNCSIRILGSNAYSISLIASGKSDIGHFSEISPILVTLAKLFIQESGGDIISDNPLILSNGCSSIDIIGL